MLHCSYMQNFVIFEFDIDIKSSLTLNIQYFKIAYYICRINIKIQKDEILLGHFICLSRLRRSSDASFVDFCMLYIIHSIKKSSVRSFTRNKKKITKISVIYVL